MTTAVGYQKQQEMHAGYRSGFNGEPYPHREKGEAFKHGWHMGEADREEASTDNTTRTDSK